MIFECPIIKQVAHATCDLVGHDVCKHLYNEWLRNELINMVLKAKIIIMIIIMLIIGNFWTFSFEKGITLLCTEKIKRSWAFRGIGCGWGLRNSEAQLFVWLWSFDLAASTQTKKNKDFGPSVSHQISLSLFFSTFLNQ